MDCGFGSCVNSIGSYTCSCPEGFEQGEGEEQCRTCTEKGFRPSGPLQPCEDIDECGLGYCGFGSCENEIGNFTCNCSQGFEQGVGEKQCRTCKDGFKLSESLQSCEDIDECELVSNTPPSGGAHPTELGFCGYGDCENSIGTFTCFCPEGFEKGEGDQQCRTCKDEGFRPSGHLQPCNQDIDECLESSPDCGNGVCRNLRGGFICDCNQGFYNFLHKPSEPCGKTKNIFMSHITML